MIIEQTGESFELHWAFTDYKDKVVLDLGADFGSTADCFMQVGAKGVIPVEGDLDLYNKLKVKYPNAVYCYIDNYKKMNDILTKYSADIVKVDIEFAEVWLLFQENTLLAKFNTWLIEGHQKDLTNAVEYKFLNAGFSYIRGRVVYSSDMQVLCFGR